MMTPRLITKQLSIRGALGSLNTRILGLGAAVLMSSAALAQDTEALRPPKVADPPSAPKVMVFLLIVLLVGAVVFAATLKTKRGHQD
ncbi:MAG: hypothetical protein KC996_00460 [Phycisphaerales bacterium]|nr:hypothetical protein [Phycisphaerales bacterium]